MAFDDLSKRGKRNRRKLDPNNHPSPVVATTPMRTVKEKKKRGRPLLPYEKLTKEGRRRRKYRARLALLGVPQLLTPLLAAAAVVDPEEAIRQEAEEAAAQARAQAAACQLANLQKQLGVRNPAANGSAHHDSEACPADSVTPRQVPDCCCICLDDLVRPCPSRGPDAWGSTTCCASYVHAECVKHWVRVTGAEIAPYIGDLSSTGHGHHGWWLSEKVCGRVSPHPQARRCCALGQLSERVPVGRARV